MALIKTPSIVAPADLSLDELKARRSRRLEDDAAGKLCVCSLCLWQEERETAEMVCRRMLIDNALTASDPSGLRKRGTD